MRVGIDASNLRAGGTATYLIELLRAANPPGFGFDEVFVWAGSAVLNKIEDRQWLRKSPQHLLEQAANPFTDRRQLLRAYWQRFRLRKLAESVKCDVLFVPGGLDNSGFHPIVTMSHNMLPFDLREASRYGWSLSRLRLWMLRRLQTRTFRQADGLIFLTAYAREVISQVGRINGPKTIVIPHGVSPRFSFPPRGQRDLSDYSFSNPFRVLYVSTVNLYKHQWHVVEAIAQLRAAGSPVALDLVGPAYQAGLQKLTNKLNSLDTSSDFVQYRGVVSYDVLHHLYQQADLKVFASSCENMPIILMEAMAAGLPIACSKSGPMPEVLGDAGVYFDPESPQEIANAIEALIRSPQIRARNAAMGFERAQQYSWERCAGETFAFLAECARRKSEHRQLARGASQAAAGPGSNCGCGNDMRRPMKNHAYATSAVNSGSASSIVQSIP
jgi:glycosyltransferase involved in cell wall biosynthesis